MVDKKYSFELKGWPAFAVLVFSVIGFVHVVVKIFGG